MYMYIYKQYIIINTFNSLGTCFEKKASICFGKVLEEIFKRLKLFNIRKQNTLIEQRVTKIKLWHLHVAVKTRVQCAIAMSVSVGASVQSSAWCVVIVYRRSIAQISRRTVNTVVIGITSFCLLVTELMDEWFSRFLRETWFFFLLMLLCLHPFCICKNKSFMFITLPSLFCFDDWFKLESISVLMIIPTFCVASFNFSPILFKCQYIFVHKFKIFAFSLVLKHNKKSHKDKHE